MVADIWCEIYIAKSFIIAHVDILPPFGEGTTLLPAWPFLLTFFYPQLQWWERYPPNLKWVDLHSILGFGTPLENKLNSSDWWFHPCGQYNVNVLRLHYSPFRKSGQTILMQAYLAIFVVDAQVSVKWKRLVILFC